MENHIKNWKKKEIRCTNTNNQSVNIDYYYFVMIFGSKNRYQINPHSEHQSRKGRSFSNPLLTTLPTTTTTRYCGWRRQKELGSAKVTNRFSSRRSRNVRGTHGNLYFQSQIWARQAKKIIVLRAPSLSERESARGKSEFSFAFGR